MTSTSGSLLPLFSFSLARAHTPAPLFISIHTVLSVIGDADCHKYFRNNEISHPKCSSIKYQCAAEIYKRIIQRNVFKSIRDHRTV